MLKGVCVRDLVKHDTVCSLEIGGFNACMAIPAAETASALLGSL